MNQTTLDMPAIYINFIDKVTTGDGADAYRTFVRRWKQVYAEFTVARRAEKRGLAALNRARTPAQITDARQLLSGPQTQIAAIRQLTAETVTPLVLADGLGYPGLRALKLKLSYGFKYAPARQVGATLIALRRDAKLLAAQAYLARKLAWAA
jgi:hypothetical protein